MKRYDAHSTYLWRINTSQRHPKPVKTTIQSALYYLRNDDKYICGWSRSIKHFKTILIHLLILGVHSEHIKVLGTLSPSILIFITVSDSNDLEKEEQREVQMIPIFFFLFFPNVGRIQNYNSNAWYRDIWRLTPSLNDETIKIAWSEHLSLLYNFVVFLSRPQH